MLGDDTDNLSEEDQAALAEYEAEGGTAEPEPQSKAEKLTQLFHKTPEMQECRQTADSINNNLNLEDTVAVQLDMPREFIRLTEFLEQKRATAAGVMPLPTPKVLNQVCGRSMLGHVLAASRELAPGRLIVVQPEMNPQRRLVRSVAGQRTS